MKKEARFTAARDRGSLERKYRLPTIIYTVNIKGKIERVKFSNKNSPIDFARVRRERAREGWSWRVLARAENQLRAIPSLAGIYS